MPNHVTNQVRVTGNAESLAKFKAQMFVPGQPDSVSIDSEGIEGLVFDFNGIIPMPEELNITEGSITYAMEAWNKIDASCPGFGELLKKIKPPLYERLKQHVSEYIDLDKVTKGDVENLFKQQPSLADKCNIDLEYGEKIRRNTELYGFPTWYPWCLSFWGTKWNAYHQHLGYFNDGEIYIEFDTAWSPPEPVFAAIAQAYPDLSMEIRYIDEGGGFAGTFTAQDGCLHDEPCPDEDFREFSKEYFGWLYDWEYDGEDGE